MQGECMQPQRGAFHDGPDRWIFSRSAAGGEIQGQPTEDKKGSGAVCPLAPLMSTVTLSKTSLVPPRVELDARLVFIGNLSPTTLPKDIADFLAPFGLVDRVTLLCDHATLESKGYAYAAFNDRRCVDRAVKEANGRSLGGSVVRIAPKRTNYRGRRGRKTSQ